MWFEILVFMLFKIKNASQHFWNPGSILTVFMYFFKNALENWVGAKY